MVAALLHNGGQEVTSAAFDRGSQALARAGMANIVKCIHLALCGRRHSDALKEAERCAAALERVQRPTPSEADSAGAAEARTAPGAEPPEQPASSQAPPAAAPPATQGPAQQGRQGSFPAAGLEAPRAAVEAGGSAAAALPPRVPSPGVGTPRAAGIEPGKGLGLDLGLGWLAGGDSDASDSEDECGGPDDFENVLVRPVAWFRLCGLMLAHLLCDTSGCCGWRLHEQR